jgi:tetratricopeptide (TPR) repeat protein
MRRIFVLILLSAFSPALFAQHPHSAPPPRPAILESEMGSHHHPVSTANAEAQKFFDQGLTFVYAFNHDEAIKSFQRAADLDPQLAMAHWGIALALGPNINLDVDPEREKAAWNAAQKALALSKNAPEHEQAYINALVQRYSNDPKADLKKLAVAYKEAMGILVKRYPDDLDLATLYAEAAMNLRPWKLWTRDGTPAEGTEEIVSVLESVLRRDPDHIGANHYYIHAVEASRNPDRAFASAERLHTLVPAAGHLVHMPAHIYMRTGNYKGATEANARAAEVDRAYIAKNGMNGIYPMMYYNHNLHFLASAAAMEGRYAEAREAAVEVAKNADAIAREMTMLQGPTQWPALMMVRFSRWDEILKLPQSTAGSQANALWHFARGMAYAETGRTAEAEREQKQFTAAFAKIPPDEAFMLNNGRDVISVAQVVLEAKIAEVRKENDRAVELLREAIRREDALSYDEPANWPNPVRENLGGLLLRLGRYDEAEKVFREELTVNPRNGRSLFGLMKTLEAKKETAGANAIRGQFEKAWARADAPLRVEDL